MRREGEGEDEVPSRSLVGSELQAVRKGRMEAAMDGISAWQWHASEWVKVRWHPRVLPKCECGADRRGKAGVCSKVPSVRSVPQGWAARIWQEAAACS